MKNIQSIKDPMVIEARQLQSATYRTQQNKTLLFGVEQLRWAIHSGLKVQSIFVADNKAIDLDEFNYPAGLVFTTYDRSRAHYKKQ